MERPWPPCGLQGVVYIFLETALILGSVPLCFLLYSLDLEPSRRQISLGMFLGSL